MNILLISFDYPPLKGGIARLSYQVAKNLSAHDKVFLIVPAIKGYKEFDRGSNLATLRVTNIKIIREIVLFFAMLYLIPRLKIEVIYDLAWYPEAAVSYFVSLFTGVPYVLHVHAADYFEDRRGFLNKLKYNRLRGRIKNLTLKGAKRIITVSNFTKKILVDDGLDGSKITVIPNGIDPNHFKPQLNARDVVLKYGLENKKILLTVSRLDDYKGHDMALRTLPRLISRFPDIKYIIVGEGPYEKHLRKLVDELNLDKYVVFAGWVDEFMLPLYYNACDIFIMLSRENREAGRVEGFGIVFLEAGACGKPIIAGRSGGIGDAVIDGVTGILVDPLNLDEIDNAITRILNDRRYAEFLGANSLARIKEDSLDWDSVSLKIRDVLLQVRD